MLMGLDPGPKMSAYVVLEPDTRMIARKGKVTNEALLDLLRAEHDPERAIGIDMLVIEQIAAMGMSVGAEVFETCVLSGRAWEAAEAAGIQVRRLKRIDIKLHLCGTARAKDPNVRQALIDRYGGSSAIGRKAAPGPLYGVSADQWSALAVATVWYEQQKSRESWDRKFQRDVEAATGLETKGA